MVEYPLYKTTLTNGNGKEEQSPAVKHRVKVGIPISTLDKQYSEKYPQKANWEIRNVDDSEPVPVDEEMKLFIDGSTRLLEFLLDSKMAGEDFDYIVALDKSARLPLFFFLTFCKALMQEKKLPLDFEMPKVRYINIGMTDEIPEYITGTGGKIADTFAAGLSKRLREIIGKKILIIDEYVKGGTSLSYATDFMQSHGAQGTTGIQMMTHYGYWWKKPDIQQTSDPQITKNAREFIKNNLEFDSGLLTIFRSVANLANNVDKLNKLAEQIDEILYEEIEIDQTLPDEVKLLITECRQKGLSNFDVKGVLHYIKSYGGLSSIKQEIGTSSMEHREYLKDLAIAVAQDTEIHQL